MISVLLPRCAKDSIIIHSALADGRRRASDDVDAEEPKNLNAGSRLGVDEQLLVGAGRPLEGDDVAGLETFLLDKPAPTSR